MSIQETVLLGVISSIIASIVFYLLMILIKPKFIISHKMSKTPVDSEYTDYMIKVVNMTRTVITNVSYSLEYCCRTANCGRPNPLIIFPNSGEVTAHSGR